MAMVESIETANVYPICDINITILSIAAHGIFEYKCII